MKISLHSLRTLLTFCLAVMLLNSSNCLSQTSDKTVSLVVPLAPGGIADITARPLSIPLSRELGQTVIVENKVGAGGAVGMAYVAKQKPDGNTLLMALSSILIIPEAEKASGKPLSYSMANFTPIALVSADPTVLLVRSDSPWKTLNDLIQDAKANPNKFSYSSSGVYGTTHVAQAMLWQAAGVDILHVPYSGGGPSMTALLGGQVQMVAQAPGVAAAHLKAGTVRLLGTWGAERLKAHPDLPTMKEQGYDVELYIWSGLFAPAGLSSEKLAQLRKAAKNAIGDSAFLTTMGVMNTPVKYLEGTDLDKFIAQDQKRLAVVIKNMGKLE
jgi:tripartite-type tricarboxylate transporter receptor subunit TctC